jgi:hypothetical protein
MRKAASTGGGTGTSHVKKSKHADARVFNSEAQSEEISDDASGGAAQKHKDLFKSVSVQDEKATSCKKAGIGCGADWKNNSFDGPGKVFGGRSARSRQARPKSAPPTVHMPRRFIFADTRSLAPAQRARVGGTERLGTSEKGRHKCQNGSQRVNGECASTSALTCGHDALHRTTRMEPGALPARQLQKQKAQTLASPTVEQKNSSRPGDCNSSDRLEDSECVQREKCRKSRQPQILKEAQKVSRRAVARAFGSSELDSFKGAASGGTRKATLKPVRDDLSRVGFVKGGPWECRKYPDVDVATF